MKEVLSNYLKNNLPTKQTTIQIFSLFILCLCLAGLGHELTHVVLNDFRADEICILNCPPVEGVGMFGNHYAPMGVHLLEPINPLAKDEDFVGNVGLGFFGLTFIPSMYLLGRRGS